MDVIQAAQRAKLASPMLAALDSQARNAALGRICDALKANVPAIIEANHLDLAAAEKDNLAAPLLKRLKFDQAKIDEVCEGIRSLIGLPDPVGKTLSATKLDEGLELYKVSCPIGVVGVIFESRPDALVQIASLCLKSGNCCLLKGGSEALNTNRILARIIVEAAGADVPAGFAHLLETRQDVAEMLALHKYIDLLIPRGSNEFVQYIMNNTKISVMGHADGICHIYIDAAADLDMAVDLAVDSKCQYPAVCNAVETLLVHADVAVDFLPAFKVRMDEANAKILGCEKTREIIDVAPATDADWSTEYLDYIISVKVVGDISAAIEHISTFGSGHTDMIVTENSAAAASFMRLVDSADVFWNASTRFADGFRFGLGAEVGISTAKIHARGPVGLEGLMIYKWLLKGSGQKVAPYAAGTKHFLHETLNRQFEI